MNLKKNLLTFCFELNKCVFMIIDKQPCLEKQTINEQTTNLKYCTKTFPPFGPVVSAMCNETQWFYYGLECLNVLCLLCSYEI